MSTTFIFAAGVICFGFTLIGVILTVYEFKNITQSNPNRVAPAQPTPLTVDFAEQIGRAHV